MVTSIASSLGIGSGIDTAQLVKDLSSAVNDPKIAAVTARADLNTAKVSALASATSSIDNFATALSSLISGGSLFTQPTSSDASVLGASALPGARLGGLAATVEVKALAQAQTLVSGYFANSAATIGTGTLTIVRGSSSVNVTIASPNNTLAGLAKAINAANAGVTATIVTDTNGARLTIKGATGAAQAFTLTGDAALSDFAYDPNISGAMTRAVEAKDALLTVDGVEVSRSSNSISDLIPGVKLDLKKAAIGSPVSLGFSRPTESISQAVQDFVAAYNELKSGLDTATAPRGADGSAGGPLRGDLGIRRMQTELAKLPSMKLASQGSFTTLADIGVKTNRDGTLAVDLPRLTTALANDPDAVEALFNPTQYSSSPLIEITSAMGKAKPGVYTLENIVPQDGTTPASGKIAGVTAISSSASLIAAGSSAAVGLVIRPLGSLASGTVTIDPGLGGALQGIRDALRANKGPLANSAAALTLEAKAIATDKVKVEERAAAYTERLTRQFTAMEKAVSSYKATQSYLEQQIQAWNNSNN